MIRKLIATDNDAATTILRLVLGVVFFAHGAQKMLGFITALIQEKDPPVRGPAGLSSRAARFPRTPAAN